MSHDVMQANP